MVSHHGLSRLGPKASSPQPSKPWLTWVMLCAVHLRCPDLLCSCAAAASVTLEASPLWHCSIPLRTAGTVYFTSCTDLPVALNRQGFYDTLRSYMLNLYSVRTLV